MTFYTSEDFDRPDTKIYNDNFFNVLPTLESKSVDLVFADLPYNCTDCEWDKEIIDLEKMWIELKRIAKSDRTPFIFTCTTQFGYELIKSNPKWFKMDMVWKKRNKTGGLQSRFRPMRNHEMIYFFYKKAPLYNRDTYHKRIKTAHIKAHSIPKHAVDTTESKKKQGKDAFGNNTRDDYQCGKYEPPNPGSTIDLGSICPPPMCDPNVNEKGKSVHGYDIEYMNAPRVPAFEPKLPASVQEYEVDNKVWGWETDKLDPAMRGKEGFDPKLPVSCFGTEGAKTKVIGACCHGQDDPECEECDETFIKNKSWGYTHNKKTMDIKNRVGKGVAGGIGSGMGHFEPHLPTSVIDDYQDEWYECTCDLENPEELPQTIYESKKVFIGKRNHQTEKPIDLMEFILKYWSKENDTILDHTMGSGSMGVACLNLKRKFIGCEMNEKIFKIAVNRLIKKK